MTTASGAKRAPTIRHNSPTDEVEETIPKVKPVTLSAGYSFTDKTLHYKGKPVK